jgi:4-diphosphocytidyl-2-C-methyl-D-erythritol kinase
MFADAASLGFGVHIRLVKRIPAGAGLGGGSSDAAAVLRALNEISSHALSDDELFELGVRLGSDVPFFLADVPLALAWGRGERMIPLPPLPAAAVILAVPPERVSTAEAYAALEGERRTVSTVLREPASWHDVAAIAENDFESVIFQRHPRLAELRTALEDAGAVIARMTGTGSAIFAVFSDVVVASEAAHGLEQAHPDVAAILTQTRASA